MRSEGSIHLDIRKIRFQRDKVWKIARVGLAAGLQGTFFSISNCVDSVYREQLWSHRSRGQHGGQQYLKLCLCLHERHLSGGITFTGQNVGARKYDRISRLRALRCWLSWALASFWAAS